MAAEADAGLKNAQAALEPQRKSKMQVPATLVPPRRHCLGLTVLPMFVSRASFEIDATLMHHLKFKRRLSPPDVNMSDSSLSHASSLRG